MIFIQFAEAVHFGRVYHGEQRAYKYREASGQPDEALHERKPQRPIDIQLNFLRDSILLLGEKTEAAVQRAMRPLIERNSELARALADEDKVIDRMELEIEHLSIDNPRLAAAD